MHINHPKTILHPDKSHQIQRNQNNSGLFHFLPILCNAEIDAKSQGGLFTEQVA